MTRSRGLSTLLAAPMLVAFFLVSCTDTREARRPDPREVEAVTTGEISRHGTVRVVFTRPIGDESGTLLDHSPLVFEPAIAGTASWLDQWTLVFTPSKPLRPDSTIHVRFDPSRAARGALAALKPFAFSVRVVPQSVTLVEGSLVVPNAAHPETMEYVGTLRLADNEEPDSLQAVLRAQLGGRRLPVTIDGKGPSDRFTVRVGGIERAATPVRLDVSWRGAAVAARGAGTHSLTIPARGSFELLDVRPVATDERYVEIVFSDPLETDQDLQGLVTSPDVAELRFTVQSNHVKLYSPSKLPSAMRVNFSGSIASAGGIELAQATSRSVHFPTEKPQVRFVGSGVIVPTTQGVTVPIETMNLNAIMVEAVQIYGSNIHQFLQVNKLNENGELERVGEVVWRKVVDLGWNDANLDQWVRYGLDLTPLLKRDPAGLYQLRLTFRKPHIQYPGPGGAPAGARAGASAAPTAEEVAFGALVTGPVQQAEASSWDYFEPNYSWEYEQHRFDPLHDAYYVKYSDHDIAVARNLMVSNIGLIVKQGADSTLHVFASDLRDTAPLSAAALTVYNYQHRVLARAVTDPNGIARIDASSGVPFFLLAEKDGQYGYLRIDDASLMSTSQFDVGGVKPEKGLQGFVYGERGIWRPGDPIYLTLIVNDPLGSFAVGHPVGFELYDPRGQLAEHRVLDYARSGFYSLKAETAIDAPTGSWSAKFYVGGQTFSKELKVESIMPNRLKISLDYGDKGLGGGQFNAKLAARWLHGAIARNLRADVKVVLSPMATRFAGFGDYTFDDPTREFVAEPQTVFDGTLDETGSAAIDGRLYVDEAPGRLNATVTTRVFEPGGSFSTEFTNVPYDPFDRYIGLRLPKGDVARGMLRTDEDQTVDLVMVDRNGAFAGNGEARVELFKIGWRWWWETDSENLAGYVSRSSYRALKSDVVELKDGRGSWTFQLKYPEWGRFLVRVTDLEGGHSSAKIVYIDWPGWAGHGQESGTEGAALLSLSADRSSYDVGDPVSVTLPTSADGRALAIVEAGGKIVQANWVLPKGETTSFRFTATPEMAPTAYVHVSYLQPHLQTANDRPIRTYGIIPIAVQDPASHLHPVITSSDTFRPGETARITVAERDARAMTYTLAIVDEGLLGITRFETPDPWRSFFVRRASTLRSWDLYDFVAGAFSGQLSTLLAIGGGEEGAAAGGRNANRFQPVVIFVPPTALAAGEQRTHEIAIPEYVGAVRVMVVAGAPSTFGRADKEVPVRKEVMLLGTLPRVIGPGETIEVPVTLFAMEERVKNVSVTIETDGPLSVVDKAWDLLRFDAPGEQQLSFTIKAANEVGIGRVRLRAEGGGAEATQTIEIAVRPAAPPVTEVVELTVRPGATVTQQLELNGLRGTNRLTVEASRIPPIDLTKNLRYLVQYPHGCIEQTTSSVFPQLYLDKLMRLSPERLAEVQANIKAGIVRLGLFQTPSGGFGYWPGDGTANEWASSYAGHFLIEAKNRGYAVPDNLLDGWARYQKSQSGGFGSGGDKATQAYRLFTLALAGQPDLGSMNRLRERGSLPDAVKWRLAYAYQLAGRATEAMNMVRSARTSVARYVELGNTFGNDLRDKAMILEALVALGDADQAGAVARDLSTQLGGREGGIDHQSTQTTAYCLLAMAKFGMSQESEAPTSFAYSWRGGGERSVRIDKPVASESVALGDESGGALALRNDSKNTTVFRLISEGVPAPGSERDVSSGLELRVGYEDLDGRTIDPGAIRPGDDLRVVVRVRNPSRDRGYENVALSHLVPSGWEIQNTRLSSGVNESAFDYRDIRDDRVYTYFKLRPGETKAFVLLANASYRGSFYLPLVSCEAMYDPTLQAVTKGRWVAVGGAERAP